MSSPNPVPPPRPTSSTDPSAPSKIGRRGVLVGSAVGLGATLSVLPTTPAHGTGGPHRRPPSLELDEKRYIELDADFLQVETAHYPRIKKMRDGRFLLLYQGSQHSWDVFCTTSRDLKRWDEPYKLFASHKINDGADDRCYATADACVLDNGDILVVCSYRVDQGFSSRMELDGLMMRRSRDHGRTWSKEKSIYVGANWEPYVHQTDTGEVQVYFTHIAPKLAVEQTEGSTGVAIIRSYDNGRSWTPDVREYPYAADRIAQQYTRTNDEGVQMFTDQMPSVLQLGRGGRMAMAMESHLANDDYMISLVHTRHNWSRTLEMNESGPDDRADNLFLGAGPYLARFPAGPSVLAYNRSGKQHIRLGDREAREFGDPETFLPGDGFWGAIELISRRRLVTTMTNTRDDGNRIMIGVLDLVR